MSKNKKIKNCKFVCEDCGDISAQTIIHNADLLQDVEIYLSTPIKFAFKTKFKIITRSYSNYELLKNVGNNIKFKKYPLVIFEGDLDKKYKTKYDYGVIMPLSTDDFKLFKIFLQVSKSISTNNSVLISYHPQEKYKNSIKTPIRNRKIFNDVEFVGICNEFISSKSSLDELVQFKNKKLNYINLNNWNEFINDKRSS